MMRGLYIHLPFCKTKCRYCGFYSVTDAGDSFIKRYLDHTIEDLKNAGVDKFNTLYIGGGTPSHIPKPMLDEFIKTVLDNIEFKYDEFTIEANPESVDDEFLKIIDKYRINRVSLGAQSFNDLTLELLSRIHSAENTVSAYHKLRSLDIDINLDVIYDIPHTSKESILVSIENVIALNPEHISAYSYSSEDTGYLEGIFDSDNSQFIEIEELLEKHDYMKYETSNFAKAGKVSKHNMIYWNMDEYIGIGASAASMIYLDGKRIRYKKSCDIERYMSNYDLLDEYEELDSKTAIYETVVFGLRLKNGVSLDDTEKRFGKIDDNLIKSINDFSEKGFLEWKDGKIRATKQGSVLLDSLSSLLWRQ